MNAFPVHASRVASATASQSERASSRTGGWANGSRPIHRSGVAGTGPKLS
jgi:hypothetical protein